MTLDDLISLPVLPEIFGDIRLCAFVVADIDLAIAHWKQHGVKAFIVTRSVSPMQNAVYLGEKCGDIPVHIAFGLLGDMQIELIEPVHDVRSVYTDAQKRGKKGVHHYAVCAEDFPTVYNFAMDNGYRAIIDSGVDGLGRMSYIENTDTGVILELIEWNTLTRPFFDKIKLLCSQAEKSGEDADFSLASLTPKGAILPALARFAFKKITGQVKTARTFS